MYLKSYVSHAKSTPIIKWPKPNFPLLDVMTKFLKIVNICLREWSFKYNDFINTALSQTIRRSSELNNQVLRVHER
jgi:hypothetical protein